MSRAINEVNRWVSGDLMKKQIKYVPVDRFNLCSTRFQLNLRRAAFFALLTVLCSLAVDRAGEGLADSFRAQTRVRRSVDGRAVGEVAAIGIKAIIVVGGFESFEYNFHRRLRESGR